MKASSHDLTSPLRRPVPLGWQILILLSSITPPTKQGLVTQRINGGFDCNHRIRLPDIACREPFREFTSESRAEGGFVPGIA